MIFCLKISIFLLLHVTCNASVLSRPLLGGILSKPRSEREITTSDLKCGGGKFFENQSGQCQSCPKNTFLTEQMANDGKHTLCVPCYKADKLHHEVEKKPCTKTSDAEVLCEESYYRKVQSSHENSINLNLKFECTRCGECGIGNKRDLNYTKEACHDYTDTVCCQNDSMMVDNGKCTLKLGDTRTTRTPKPATNPPPLDVTETTEHALTHQRNHSDVLFLNSSLVFVAFLLCILIGF